VDEKVTGLGDGEVAFTPPVYLIQLGSISDGK
jgi:hypothetical protein